MVGEGEGAVVSMHIRLLLCVDLDPAKKNYQLVPRKELPASWLALIQGAGHTEDKGFR